MTIQTNFPAINPSLNLNFAKTKILDSRITFTRASTATYYGTQTAKAEENLLLQSQDFTTTWSTSSTNATVTGNTSVAPDGTTTADTLAPTATTGSHFVFQTITASSGNTFTVSVFAKKGTHDFIQLSFNGYTTHFVNFDISTGTVGSVNGAGSSASMQAVGNNWYRCIYVYPSATETQIRIAQVTSNTAARIESWTAAGTETVFLWGAQLEQRSAVTAYTATTTQAITNYIPVLLTAQSGVPRFDHNPTTFESLGLLIEESRTNLLTYSAQFDNAVWTKTRSSITSNTVVAPDGMLTGDALITDTTVTDTHRIELLSVAFTSGTTYTLTLFAKAQSSLNLQLVFLTSAFGTSLRAAFNLETGQTLVSSSSITAKTTNVGNGWFRCEATATATATATSGFHISLINTFAATAAATSFTGDGTSGIYIWGAQLEAGAFATSYIPTVAATVTRAADAASMTGTNFTSWFNAAEGTLYIQSGPTNPTVNVGQITATIGDGTANNRMYVGKKFDSATVAEFGITVNGSGQGFLLNTPTSMTNFKLAAAYKVNDFASVTDGGAIVTDTSGIIPVVNLMYIGALGASSSFLCGTIKKIAYYPIRVTNAQLQALTS